MKHKAIMPIVKKEDRTTSTRNAVETAIDLSKDGQRWVSSEEIQPWQPNSSQKICNKGLEEEKMPA